LDALCLPLLSHVFMTDFVRIAPETVRLVFEFCLSPKFPTDVVNRDKTLLGIMSVTKQFYHAFPGFCGPLRSMPLRHLQFRLKEAKAGHLDVTKELDIIPATKADVLSALNLFERDCPLPLQVC
jgi:hypothetical protein